MSNVNEVEYTEVENSELGDVVTSNFDLTLLNDLKVQVEAKIGDTYLELADLYKIRNGEVIKLTQETDQLIELSLNGKVIAFGQLVAVDGYFGIKVTEAPK